MIRLHRPDFDWYLQRLFAGTPTTLLLYGDGEFLVALRERTHQRMAYDEIVQPWLEDEMIASFELPGYDILRGTDKHLIDWRSYHGGDAASFCLIGQRVERFLEQRDLDFYDATCWEWAVREGRFAPFLEWLSRQNVVIVGHPALRKIRFLCPDKFIEIPPTNAVAYLDNYEAELLQYGKPGVYLFCMGVGAVPLICRLYGKIPGATLLDLGSHLDIFAKLPTRGWREDLLADPVRYEEAIRENTRGVPLCVRY